LNDVAGLKSQGKLPEGFPEGPGEFLFDGKPATLGDVIGEGTNALVVDEVGQPTIMKFLKWVGDQARSVYDDMQQAEALLDEADIYHLRIELGPRPNGSQVVWLRQSRLPEGAIIPKYGQALSEGQRQAVMSLVDQLYEAKLGFEDCKGDNLFLRPLGGDKWLAGVLDVDRICKWGSYTTSIDEILSRIETGVSHLFGHGLNCVIPGGVTGYGKRLMNFEEFWKIQLEKGGWLRYEGDGFVDRSLNAAEVFDKFKWLGSPKGKVNLARRTATTMGGPNPTVAPPPPPGPPLLSFAPAFGRN
ncbi:MAG TPA: hypothetical protein VKT78_01590, partial [Fimbriimonadaceae bacterium]|nr:hypothetical protein [Fimbriimonadaceae bacterium]